jgi:hypothetical protein
MLIKANAKPVCLSLWATLILAGVANFSSVFADESKIDAALLTTCIAQVGLDKAALARTSGGCVGLVREPCLPDVPNTAESVNCLSREDAAWVLITDTALAAAKAKMGGQSYKKLERQRSAWIKAIAVTCAPEEQGTLANIASEYCEQTEVAKLALYVLRAKP